MLPSVIQASISQDGTRVFAQDQQFGRVWTTSDSSLINTKEYELHNAIFWWYKTYWKMGEWVPDTYTFLVQFFFNMHRVDIFDLQNVMWIASISLEWAKRNIISFPDSSNFVVAKYTSDFNPSFSIYKYELSSGANNQHSHDRPIPSQNHWSFSLLFSPDRRAGLFLFNGNHIIFPDNHC
jgi:hypothetical protein